jgi:hypothetical protein
MHEIVTQADGEFSRADVGSIRVLCDKLEGEGKGDVRRRL